MRVKDVLADFLLALEAAGRSPATVVWYRARLARLAELAAPIERIDAPAIRAWLLCVKRGLRGAATSDNYVESHRRAAARLFTWAVREGALARSPMANVEKGRIRRREITVLSPEEIARLFAATPARTAKGLRDRAMLAVLYDSGVRVGELVTMQVSDVDLGAGTALVRGKTGEGRVPLSIECRRVVLAYLQRARGRMFAFADPGVLFVGKGGRPLAPNGIRQWLRKLARHAGIAKRISPHTFRHSFSTQYLRNGGDPFTLQRILRHRTAAMTQRYVHLAMADVEERHRTASPLARMLGAGG